MNQILVSHFLIILVLLIAASTHALDYAKWGCKDMCGEVLIPYPFGIGRNCSLNKWYAIDCNSSTPYLSAFRNLEVLIVDLKKQTVTVNSTVQNNNSSVIRSVYLGGSPFLFSKTDNVFVVDGCGNATILDDSNRFAGCSNTCPNGNNYSSVTSCQTPIPYYLQSYTLDLSRLQRLDGGRHGGSAFLVDEEYYYNLYPEVFGVWNKSFIPITLMWTLTRDQIPNCWAGKLQRPLLYLGHGSIVYPRKCYCGVGREGNPYLNNRCQELESCKYCRDSGKICQYDESNLDDDDIENGAGFNCIYPSLVYHTRDLGGSKSPIGVILGVTISLGLLFLAKIIFELYKLIKKTKTKRRKEKFFKHNGGILLKQRQATDTSLVDKTILFTATELEKATNHFDENRILGRGGQGTVYKGMLTDGRIVAVKKSKVVDERQLQQFINEVVILSQVNHRNVVRLLGCCLETEVPLLVSEFIPNGTLYDLIQDHTSEFPISLNLRLQIAIEVAGALSYLHSETSIPIYHRDIKTTNILMDEKYRAKVSDFGTSRLVSVDKTHLTTLVKGTFGYFDPEYFQSSQFTEKSDVYSFGVVLLELLTREKPISFTRFGENRNLSAHFMLAMEEGRVMSIFDVMIVNEASRDELLAIAHLAMRCLNFNGKNRPTMKEVAVELEGMRMSHVPSSGQTSFGQVYSSNDIMLPYDESMSTTITMPR